eukprot:scaffold150535_cov15-Prasinocladus_malaysianus.AAC.1
MTVADKQRMSKETERGVIDMRTTLQDLSMTASMASTTTTVLSPPSSSFAAPYIPVVGRFGNRLFDDGNSSSASHAGLVT